MKRGFRLIIIILVLFIAFNGFLLYISKEGDKYINYSLNNLDNEILYTNYVPYPFQKYGGNFYDEFDLNERTKININIYPYLMTQNYELKIINRKNNEVLFEANDSMQKEKSYIFLNKGQYLISLNCNVTYSNILKVYIYK